MRVLTLVSSPKEVNAVAALGAREVLAPFPARTAPAGAVADYFAASAAFGVELWFAVDDVRGVPRMHDLVERLGAGVPENDEARLVCRRPETARQLRAALPRVRLTMGPWPEAGRGIDAGARNAPRVDRVWGRRWLQPEQARELVERASQAHLELVLAMPPGIRMREWEAQPAIWGPLCALLDSPNVTWAVCVQSDKSLEARCGELMELRTVLATKPGYRSSTWTAAAREQGSFPYDQTEGFPLVYAELMRHPPAIPVEPADARARLRVDEPADSPHAPERLSAYVHVPFCVRRCQFCFCSAHCVHEGNAGFVSGFVDALCGEIDLWAGARIFGDRRFDSLYVGGGSPSALAPRHLARILGRALERLSFVAGPVVSVEMAPSSVSARKLRAARDAGANRVSFGVQSFDDRTLRTIGSAHSAADAVEAIESAHAAGFEDVDVDLIYGVPGQTPADHEADVERAAALSVASAMLFPLHVTPQLLAWWAECGVDCRAWNAARYHELWTRGNEVATRLGYVRFGYSHYKRPLAAVSHDAVSHARYSRHVYVLPGSDGQLALGPTALGCLGGRQYENICKVTSYVEAVRGGHLPVGSYAEPPGSHAARVWTLIERSTVPGVVHGPMLEARFGPGARAKVDELVGPLLERGLFRQQGADLELTELGAVWMANVQLELLRRAGLPAPRGHRIEV
jgi:oxygen-independent coproporphyrinogen-3 oxidase